MKSKRIFYSELAYLFGLTVLALGTALMEKADFGLSMVTAPAYILHLKVSEFIPFFSFGMSGYVLQAVLLAVLALICDRFKKSYLLSFVTAFLFGVVLDLEISVLALFSFDAVVWRVLFFAMGLVACSTGVALMFHTYFPPEAYDLFVKEISQKFGTDIGKTKTAYDICSFVLAVILSLAFYGAFVGVNWGTVICTAVNGTLIGRISFWLDKNFVFKDALMLRDKIK